MSISAGGDYQPKMQNGYGQHEQQDDEQQSHVTAKGCGLDPTVLARRSRSVSVNSVSIEKNLLLSIATTVEAEVRRPCAVSVSNTWLRATDAAAGTA